MMYCDMVLVFLVLCNLIPFFSAYERCPQNFQCGNLGTLSFPFSNCSLPHCGLFMVNCSDQISPKIALGNQPYDRWFDAKSFLNGSSIKLQDPVLQLQIKSNMCSTFVNVTHESKSPAISFFIESNITVFRCTNDSSKQGGLKDFNSLRNYTDCHDYAIFYRNPKFDSPYTGAVPPTCVPVTLPMVPWNSITQQTQLFQFFTPVFDIEWHLSDDCVNCRLGGGKCLTDMLNNYYCANHTKEKSKMGAILGAVGGGLFVLVSGFVVFLLWRCKKGIDAAPFLHSRHITDPSLQSDAESGSAYFGLPVFSYKELEEVTNHFHESNELGNGGFGTVYYGKLKDGREVAVKYLFEHNFKRMQQFKNEIDILTRLRHRNLVTLYGCTSRDSRDLLLVYEYVPNGTLADHLHGDRAKDKSLTWPMRMNIAIDTAGALAYLHASDIIHRDVKSNNILLDLNFCVKVADFGISRLFPNDVTHISTAPQGTPGYVDPEYHHFYQLTNKSDVYSFGVVLIELISSMPAVDMSRNSYDINLSNFALSRIQKRAFNELIDPSFQNESDPEVERMTTSVAELAFRCLQHEKEMRPTMEEVVETLKAIQSDTDNTAAEATNAESEISAIQSKTSTTTPSPESEYVVLLKKKINIPSSPNSVTDAWNSGSSTGTST